MFNLEKAIAGWRRQMAAGGVKDAELLAELEAHLRDDVEQQVHSGIGEAHAFEIAARRIGQPNALKREFAKAGKFKWEFLRKLKCMLLGVREVPFPPLENFALSARQTLELAPEEARRFRHDFVGTEHVLLGLARSQSGIVSNVLRRLGVSSEAIRSEIEKVVSLGATQGTAPQIPFTPRARKALQLAADQARALNQPCVNAGHIFLGLIQEGSGVAALVLSNLGVRIETAQQELINEMRARPDAA